LVYKGAGKVAPAPFSGTTGTDVVVVVATAEVVVVVEVVGGLLVVEVVASWVVVVVVVVWTWLGVVTEADWVVVVVVVELLQAVNIDVVTSSSDAITTSHFLFILLNNLLFLPSLISSIIRGYH
jgi:hypothetical protein